MSSQKGVRDWNWLTARQTLTSTNNQQRLSCKHTRNDIFSQTWQWWRGERSAWHSAGVSVSPQCHNVRVVPPRFSKTTEALSPASPSGPKPSHLLTPPSTTPDLLTPRELRAHSAATKPPFVPSDIQQRLTEGAVVDGGVSPAQEWILFSVRCRTASTGSFVV